MFAVEIYAAVRRFVFVEGKSRREAARVFGLSRDTISKMCRYSAPPGYVRSKAPERPKLGPLVPVIDAILESDKTAPPKQRHTAKRIFERLPFSSYNSLTATFIGYTIPALAFIFKEAMDTGALEIPLQYSPAIVNIYPKGVV